MTVQEAVDWITANLPTDNNGQVVFSHPQTNCPACGHDHSYGGVSKIDPTHLAEIYHTVMENSHADALGGGAPVSDVAQAAADKAVTDGTGHERFFNQV